jgi:hypothetical protein
MIDYIETTAQDGTVIRIEVESSKGTTTGFHRQASTPTNVSNETTRDAYHQTLSAIRACAAGVIDTLQKLETPPAGASIQFAIKIDAEAGALIAKSGGDAQFKISLSWKQAGEQEGASGAGEVGE